MERPHTFPNNSRQRPTKYKQPRKKSLHTMDVILLIMALLLVAFTITMIVLFCIYQQIPDTLVTAFFSAFGAEGGFMAVIMVTKKITENKDETD